MIIDKRIAEELEPSMFPNLPDPESGIAKRYKADGIDIRFIRRPGCLSSLGVVSIDYAMCAIYDGRLIYAVSSEREDLRELSHMLGVSVKELQSDYGIKGFFTPAHIIQYGDGQKEDLGLMQACDGKAVFSLFSEALLDSLDIIGELEEADV